MGEAVIINLSEPVSNCAICESIVPLRYGIPMYEDMILPNDWEEEWAGQTVCRRCFEAQEKITKSMSKRDFRKMMGKESR